MSGEHDGVPAVLFDLDGTLLDPAGAITETIAEAIQAQGHPRPDEATLRRFVGPPASVGLERHTDLDERQRRAALAAYREAYTAAIRQALTDRGLTLGDGLFDTALALGLRHFRPDVRVAGVILNRVASPRHERLARLGMQHAGLPVLGALPRRGDLTLPERHLGLIQAVEHPDLDAAIAAYAGFLRAHVDLAAIRAAATLPSIPRSPKPPGIRIASTSPRAACRGATTRTAPSRSRRHPRRCGPSTGDDARSPWRR